MWILYIRKSRGNELPESKEMRVLFSSVLYNWKILSVELLVWSSPLKNGHVCTWGQGWRVVRWLLGDDTGILLPWRGGKGLSVFWTEEENWCVCLGNLHMPAWWGFSGTLSRSWIWQHRVYSSVCMLNKTKHLLVNWMFILVSFSQPPSFLQMSNKRSNSFRRAILQGSRQLKGCSLRDEVGLGLSQRLVRHVAYETLPREVDRKWYFDSYTYCPPPWLILAITITEVNCFSLIQSVSTFFPITTGQHVCLTLWNHCLYLCLIFQVAVFMYYGFQLDRLVLQVSSPSFLKSPLPYHPQLRAQAWRYFSYIFMHTGWVDFHWHH